jgi:hypothetical protein
MGLGLVSMTACLPPVMDGEPREITAADLAAQFRDDPAGAAAAFEGQTVQVLVRRWDATETQILWKVIYSNNNDPPTIIFDLPDAKKVRPPCWIEGRCEGVVKDARSRGLPGYGFTIRVTGCRVVSRSTPVEP